MSKYSGKQFSNEDVLNFAKTDGADIAGTVSLPKMSGNNITINGTENGGKLLSRNEDGSISIKPNPNAGGRITAPIRLKCTVQSKIMLMFSLMQMTVMGMRRGL
jgi:hypothetical protein